MTASGRLFPRMSCTIVVDYSRPIGLFDGNVIGRVEIYPDNFGGLHPHTILGLVVHVKKKSVTV